jgi:ABC-type uncharacterized transport system substrate-binding protein
MAGIKERLSREKVELSVFFMDTKRKSTPEDIDAAADEALKKIESFNPDLIIASDDDGVKHVIAPHFKNKAIPVVFCGINWSAKSYGLPVSNITGMLEVLPLEKNLKTMKEYFPKATRLAVLSENSLSERKNTEILDTLYKNQGFAVSYHLVNTFDDWKLAFKKANEQADLIYLPTNGAIKGWKIDEAKLFVARNIKKPVVTCDDFMMPYCVYGLTKVAKEQGLWAAQTALEILNGKDPASIPLAKNTQSKSLVNLSLAGKVGFSPKPDLLSLSQLLKISY